MPTTVGVFDCPDLLSCALTALTASINAIASFGMTDTSRDSIRIGEEVGVKMSAEDKTSALGQGADASQPLAKVA